VREDRLLPRGCLALGAVRTGPHRDHGSPVLQADAEAHCEDPSVARARAMIAECERKLAKHLDGLEAGISADVIASRIAVVQREKAATEAVLALRPELPKL
jgi:hypothetical protein